MSGETVLIVEDDDALRSLYRFALVLAGYYVEDVATGFKALRRLETLTPHLIVLDLMLPDIDGRTVLRELATQARTRKIPVLIVTAATDVELDVACVLQKPVTNERLITAVRECLTAGAA
jgi:two-component system phosphate regulon response regulator PhoB